MPKTPFDFEATGDKLLREEWKRQKQFEQLVRPFSQLNDGGLKTAFQETALTAKHFSALLGGDTFRTLRESAEQTQAISEAIRGIINPASVKAMQETALAVSRGIPDFRKQAEQLTTALGPAFNTASRALAAQSQAMADLLGTSAWQKEMAALSAVAEAMQPSMAAIAKSADTLRMVDMATLRASADIRDTVEFRLEVFAEEAASADTALTNLAESADHAQTVRYLADFVQALTRLFARLGENTIKDVTEAGLVTWLMIAVALFEVLSSEPVDLGEADKATLAEVQSSLTTVREQLSAYEQIIAAADERFLAGLPRSEVRISANVRLHPDGSSPRSYRLSAGEIVAIVDRKGRWRYVVFRDRLTHQLSRGWVYQSSLVELGT